jgi:hypothetical protein
MKKAYLDIETSFKRQLTVVGILYEGTFTQLVGDKITYDAILKALKDTREICTYNGTCFDLPFIKKRLNLDLNLYFKHRDLMYDCWRHNLYGGLKRVEEILGIKRRLKGINGYDAMKLWQRYVEEGDFGSLEMLLLYNKEDVENLVLLEEKLREVEVLGKNINQTQDK